MKTILLACVLILASCSDDSDATNSIVEECDLDGGTEAAAPVSASTAKNP